MNLMSKLKILCLSFITTFLLSSCDALKDAIGFGVSEGSLVPVGEYVGEWKFKNKKEVSPEEREIASKVQVTLFPMEDVDITGHGVLMFNNSSHRFTWRANGNRKDAWNVLFVKDNSVFSDITTSFKFDGTLRALAVGYKLDGTLSVQYDDDVNEYFIETFRRFAPKIEAKEALAIAAGESLTINGEYFGEKADEIHLELVSKAEDKKEHKINVDSIEEVEGIQALTVSISKDLAKADYSAKLVRQDGYESNIVTITVQ